MRKMSIVYVNMFFCFFGLILTYNTQAQQSSSQSSSELDALRAVKEVIQARQDIILDIPFRKSFQIPKMYNEKYQLVDLYQVVASTCTAKQSLLIRKGKYENVAVTNNELIANYLAPATSNDITFLSTSNSEVIIDDSIVYYPAAWNNEVNKENITAIWFDCKVTLSSDGLPIEKRDITPFFIETNMGCYEVIYTPVKKKANLITRPRSKTIY